MKRITTLILLSLFTLVVKGQAIDHFLKSVEQNNPRLIALRKWLEAEAVRAKTGIYPDNPEFSYDYLWGNQASLGNPQETEITQRFNLPWYYTLKADIQHLELKQIQAMAEEEKSELEHSARTVYLSLVWLNKKAHFLEMRNGEAIRLVALMKDAFESGEISKPTFDRARIYAVDINNELSKTRSEIEVYTRRLELLNGGRTVAQLLLEYPTDWELPNLDTFLHDMSLTNPYLVMARLNTEQAVKEIEHKQMEALPVFEVGYRSERVLDQKLRGFHAGISIPLWQNANNVRHAQLQSEWSDAVFEQLSGEIKAEAISVYNEALAYKNNFLHMKAILEEEKVTASNFDLLQSGYISFTEYLVDVGLIWEAQSQLIHNEFSYYVSFSKLLSLY
ncbi:MAG TPA: TolC family protein [Bacteroidales bacterium]|nr:TolC family protein [Bacteroidales bacterium]